MILEEGHVKVEPIKLSLHRELKEIRIEKGQNLRRILEDVKDQRAIFKVILEVEANDPTLNLKVQEIHQYLGEKLAFLKLEFEESSTNLTKEIGSLNLLDLYKVYYKHTYNKDIPEDLEKELLNLLDKVHHEANKA